MPISPKVEVLSEMLIKMHFNPALAIEVINCLGGGFIVMGPGIKDEQYSRCNGWSMKFAAL